MSGPVDAIVSRVDDQLAEYLDVRAAALASVGPELQPVVDAARQLVLDGGKRLRPIFAHWGWRSVRAATDDDHALVAAATSLELLHASALVHDDLMDYSDTRRGRPAAHSAFAELHRGSGWDGDPAMFGAGVAILLGDLLMAWADSMFAGAGISAAAHPAARAVFDEMRQLVMAGQYLDVYVQARGTFSAADALRVIEFKTSKYTVEGPLHLGAAVAGAPPATFAALSAYGLPLGEAFQLRDDVLGVFGDPARTGKPAGGDLREGKRTLLVALAMQDADAEQRLVLRDGLGERALDDVGVSTLREVIVATGALARVEERITERTARARAALADDAISPDAREALDALAIAATERHT